jgi:hypothetical protein
MKEKRITVPARGGSRRHGDPPAWLDKSLSLERRRELLDRAIRELDSSQQRCGPSTGGGRADAITRGEK